MDKVKERVVTVRMQPELHQKLIEVSSLEGNSMNTTCVRLLNEYVNKYYQQFEKLQTEAEQ